VIPPHQSETSMILYITPNTKHDDISKFTEENKNCYDIPKQVEKNNNKPSFFNVVPDFS
jgi:hypothetical protein